MAENNAEQKIAFPQLSEDEIAELEKIATRQQLNDGEVLFEAGEERCGFFVMLAGAIKVVDDSGDAAQIVSIPEPREFTGDIDVLGARRAMVSAVAQGDREVLHISTDELNHVLSEQPALGDTIHNAFIERRELLVESGFQGLRVIGSQDSRQAFQLCEFLARNQVPHAWLKVEMEPDARQLLAELGVTEGVYYAATQTELAACSDTEAVVIGGGNSAGQAIMFLAQHTRRVTVLSRGDDLYACMSSYLAGRIEAAENVEVRYYSKMRRLIGDERLESVEIENTETGKCETLQTPAVFSFIGAVPCTKWLPAQIETDENGFICTGRDVTRTAPWPLER